jgi:hypothetical protein
MSRNARKDESDRKVNIVTGGHEEEGEGMPGNSRVTGRPSSDRRT